MDAPLQYILIALTALVLPAAGVGPVVQNPAAEMAEAFDAPWRLQTLAVARVPCRASQRRLMRKHSQQSASGLLLHWSHFDPHEDARLMKRESAPEKADSLEKLDLTTLVAEIARDTGTLVHQQIELLRAELVQEARRAGGGLVSIAAGGGLMAAGGLLSGMMLAHLVHRSTRLPLWACYGAVGGGLSAAGLALLQNGRENVAGVRLVPPPETAAALKENVAWVKEQVTPGSA